MKLLTCVVVVLALFSAIARCQVQCGDEICPEAYPLCSFESGYYYCIADACSAYGNELCVGNSHCVNNREGFTCECDTPDCSGSNSDASNSDGSSSASEEPVQCGDQVCPEAYPLCSFESGYYYCIADACSAYGNELCVGNSHCVNNREGFSCVCDNPDCSGSNSDASNSDASDSDSSEYEPVQCGDQNCTAAYPLCSFESGYYYCIADACSAYGNDLCLGYSRCVNNREGFSCVCDSPECTATSDASSSDSSEYEPVVCGDYNCTAAYPICSFESGYYYCIADSCATHGNELCLGYSRCVNNREGFSCVCDSPECTATSDASSSDSSEYEPVVCGDYNCTAAYPICSLESGYYYCIADSCATHGNDLCLGYSRCVNNREGFSCVCDSPECTATSDGSSSDSSSYEPVVCGDYNCTEAYPLCSLEGGYYYCIADSCAAYGDALCLGGHSHCVNNREAFSCVCDEGYEGPGCTPIGGGGSSSSGSDSDGVIEAQYCGDVSIQAYIRGSYVETERLHTVYDLTITNNGASSVSSILIDFESSDTTASVQTAWNLQKIGNNNTYSVSIWYPLVPTASFSAVHGFIWVGSQDFEIDCVGTN